MRNPPPASGPAINHAGVAPEGEEDSELDPSLASAPYPIHAKPAHAPHANAETRLQEDPRKNKREHEHDKQDKKKKPRADTQAIDGIDEGAARTLLPRNATQALDPGPLAEPGDLTLTDPEEARRALKTPVGYAKHCMILAEAFRRASGATRAEGLAYLARMFVASGDIAFGRAALKELGPSTGIIDLYPLEVIDQVLDVFPGFLPKVARGRFIQRDSEAILMDTDRPALLTYKEELKVRGFAVLGGAQPGYRFEPASAGTYRLEILTAGRYTLATSCLSKTGQIVIDRLEVTVRAGSRALPRRPIDADLPARDAEKVAAWPVPEVSAAKLEDALAASDPLRRDLQSRFTADELAQRIGVLGLANLRARMSAKREVAHEETHPSWVLERAIVIEEEEEEPEPDQKTRALIEPPLPIARPKQARRAEERPAERVPIVEPAAVRAALAQQGTLDGAGPLVARPRRLEQHDAPPTVDERSGIDTETEGEEPTGDLDRTEGVDRKNAFAEEEHTRPITVDPSAPRAPVVQPSQPMEPSEPDPTRPLDRAAVARALATPREKQPARVDSKTRPIPLERPPPSKPAPPPAPKKKPREPTPVLKKGAGFAGVRAHDKTQRVKVELEPDEEIEDHTLTELEDP